MAMGIRNSKISKDTMAIMGHHAPVYKKNLSEIPAFLKQQFFCSPLVSNIAEFF